MRNLQLVRSLVELAARTSRLWPNHSARLRPPDSTPLPPGIPALPWANHGNRQPAGPERGELQPSPGQAAQPFGIRRKLVLCHLEQPAEFPIENAREHDLDSTAEPGGRRLRPSRNRWEIGRRLRNDGEVGHRPKPETGLDRPATMEEAPPGHERFVRRHFAGHAGTKNTARTVWPS